MAVVKAGDRIMVIDRKLFRDDNTRIFVGVVEEYDEGLVRARGFPFHLSPYEVAGTERHGEERVRVISLSGEVLFYVLPVEADVDKFQLRRSPKSLTLTDGASFAIDLTEWLLRM